MSYEEKGTWSFLVVAIAGYAVYLWLVLSQIVGGTPVDEVDYAIPMLWTIGGAVVAGIVARIAIEIASPSESTRADVRDRQIDRAGEQVGNSLVVIAGIGALVLAMLQVHWFWIANAIYLGFVLSAVLGSLAKLAMYRRGLPAW
ncbi:hypothetical protein AVP42_02680 [Agromyces sp. NDB4Y10]|uniref:hypothetical protein n=1 Tax=Agromyces sp. NDB4Y10 TaxID=1775951 RepID=UPI0007B248AB|nr:hypothetical protein [Agromyces sp. NDB4Y10]KZE92216.1 hypothetical protein AVP42_02680 [Agromyces sp. NDB4Y10]